MSCCVAAHPTDTAPPCATYKAKVGVLLLRQPGSVPYFFSELDFNGQAIEGLGLKDLLLPR
jgi:hypothetical protein